MIKLFFKTKDEFVDFMWNEDDWQSNDSSSFLYLNKREQLSPFLGLQFKGLEELTDDENDDGEWAGKEHHIWNEETLPTQFPVIMSLLILKHKYDYSYHFSYVYPTDFQHV